MRKLPDTNLTESSKPPASIAKSNKQWVGTQTSGEVSWKDCPAIDYRCRYKKRECIRDYKSEGEIWLWQIQLL